MQTNDILKRCTARRGEKFDVAFCVIAVNYWSLLYLNAANSIIASTPKPIFCSLFISWYRASSLRVNVKSKKKNFLGLINDLAFVLYSSYTGSEFALLAFAPFFPNNILSSRSYEHAVIFPNSRGYLSVWINFSESKEHTTVWLVTRAYFNVTGIKRRWHMTSFVGSGALPPVT